MSVIILGKEVGSTENFEEQHCSGQLSKPDTPACVKQSHAVNRYVTKCYKVHQILIDSLSN
jgi:hypothetical protein